MRIQADPLGRAYLRLPSQFRQSIGEKLIFKPFGQEVLLLKKRDPRLRQTIQRYVMKYRLARQRSSLRQAGSLAAIEALRGSVLHYVDPTAPVGTDDWDALKN